MRILFGIAIVAVVAFTAWSEPTVGKTPTVSLDPQGMTTQPICRKRITSITAPSSNRSCGRIIDSFQQ